MWISSAHGYCTRSPPLYLVFCWRENLFGHKPSTRSNAIHILIPGLVCLGYDNRKYLNMFWALVETCHTICHAVLVLHQHLLTVSDSFQRQEYFQFYFMHLTSEVAGLMTFKQGSAGVLTLDRRSIWKVRASVHLSVSPPGECTLASYTVGII